MRYLIIGCGRVGSGLANELTLRGHQVTVVDKDPLAIERLGPVFKGKTSSGSASTGRCSKPPASSAPTAWLL